MVREALGHDRIITTVYLPTIELDCFRNLPTVRTGAPAEWIVFHKFDGRKSFARVTGFIDFIYTMPPIYTMKCKPRHGVFCGCWAPLGASITCHQQLRFQGYFRYWYRHDWLVGDETRTIPTGLITANVQQTCFHRCCPQLLTPGGETNATVPSRQ